MWVFASHSCRSGMRPKIAPFAALRANLKNRRSFVCLGGTAGVTGSGTLQVVADEIPAPETVQF